ncbi:MAG TPA: hypothetical protein VJ724_07755, partial [Tahibacter sp.]|nr:hypothetical protein [Tahibacter sp.]
MKRAETRTRAPQRPVAFDRDIEVGRVRRAIERLESPRLQMAVIVALTGAAGFAASSLLLFAGLHAMWLRYPLAVAVAYLAFLGLLWAWLRASDREEAAGEASETAADTVDLFGSIDLNAGGGRASESWGPDFDLDTGGVDL